MYVDPESWKDNKAKPEPFQMTKLWAKGVNDAERKFI